MRKTGRMVPQAFSGGMFNSMVEVLFLWILSVWLSTGMIYEVPEIPTFRLSLPIPSIQVIA